jgi:uncharacterized membrane protein
MLTMTLASLRQFGVIKHLPDPPLPGFDADKVTLSPQAFPFGIPDGPIGLAAFGATLILARAGPDDRAHTQPWLALASGAVAAGLAGGATYYVTQMQVTVKAWCAYCLATAAAALAVCALLLPEAWGAVGIAPRYLHQWSRLSVWSR